MIQLSMFTPSPSNAAGDADRSGRGSARSRLITAVAYCLSGATLLLATFIGGL